MNAERKFDNPRNAVRFAVTSIVGERLWISARRFQDAIEMPPADHAKLGGPDRLAVLLERGQQLRDVVAIGLGTAEKVTQRNVRGTNFVQDRFLLCGR